MTLSKITYKGIARAGSDQQVQDGYLEEAINTRHREGKLTARGKITKLYELPSNTYDKIWLHDQDDIYNFIGYIKSTGRLELINMTTGAGTLITTLSAGEDANIAFIKRFMIISSGDTQKVYMHYNNTYTFIQKPDPIVVSYGTKNRELIITDTASSAASLRGYYFKEVNKASEKKGKLTGGIMLRCAFRMFDGSYVMHTLPQFLSLGLEVKLVAYDASETYDQMKLGFSCANIWISALIQDVDEKIYTDFAVFACAPQSIYDISETTMDDDWWTDTIEKADTTFPVVDNIRSYRPLSIVMSTMNSDFIEMHNSTGWYKIYEVSTDEMKKIGIGGNYQFTIADDAKGFYQDYATRESLPVDQFSFLDIAGQAMYTYNDRLLIGNIKSKFMGYPMRLCSLTQDGDNYVQNREELITDFPTESGDYIAETPVLTLTNVVRSECTCAWEVTINTTGLEIVVTSESTTQLFYIASDNSKYYFCLPSVVGFPDSRATKARLLWYDSLNSRWVAIKTFSLKASSHDNYAYYAKDIAINIEPDDAVGYTQNPQTARKFIVAEISTSDLNGNVVTIQEQEFYVDSNRVQASELQNPLFFPAKNSYQVGTGRILGLAANTEPLSQGQFGEYPLAVFTSKGIWTMLQGSGDVLFSNILPLNGEVPLDPDQITPLSVGVVYSTERGLYLISGREVKNLSEVLTGPVNLQLQANAHYQYFINHDNLVQLLPYLSQIDAKLYILGAKVGYDKLNNELIVTNSAHSYSYVYSFESGYWYKTTDSFRLLVNAYPKLLGVNDSGIHSLSDEDFTGSVQVLLTTRPVKLTDNSFKLIRGAIQRCQLNTTDGTFAAFYMFASNDLRKWQFLTGNDRKEGYVTDIMISRAHTKAKYFIFILAGSLEENSMINDIDIEFDQVLQNKLR